MTPADLARIEELIAKATPPPWTSSDWLCDPSDEVDVELVIALVNNAGALLAAAKVAQATYERRTTDDERRKVAAWAHSRLVDDVLADLSSCERALTAAKAAQKRELSREELQSQADAEHDAQHLPSQCYACDQPGQVVRTDQYLWIECPCGRRTGSYGGAKREEYALSDWNKSNARGHGWEWPRVRERDEALAQSRDRWKSIAEMDAADAAALRARVAELERELAGVRKNIEASKRATTWAGWDCATSPTGKCEYNDDPDHCIHCGQPDERK